MPHTLEIRSSKSEIREKAGARSPGAGEMALEIFQSRGTTGSGIWHSNFPGISEIRISDFAIVPAATEFRRGACCYA